MDVFHMHTYQFNDEQIAKCKAFANEIAWKHNDFMDRRNNHTRTTRQKEIDILQGKLAEVAIYELLKSKYPTASIAPVDFEVYPDGEFDQGDIFIDDLVFSIKSSKPGSSVLMLETARFLTDDAGNLIGLEGNELPDVLSFVQVDVAKKEAIIAGFITTTKFWKEKVFLPRGFIMNHHNAKTALIEKIPPKLTSFFTSKGIPLRADNYAIHKQYLLNLEQIMK